MCATNEAPTPLAQLAQSRETTTLTSRCNQTTLVQRADDVLFWPSFVSNFNPLLEIITGALSNVGPLNGGGRTKANKAIQFEKKIKNKK